MPPDSFRSRFRLGSVYLHARSNAIPASLVSALACLGFITALVYSGQALLHYDAKAHLVVARRVIDSITPGWQQIGAVWLPLPHLLNLIPVQVDALYRTGASAILLSVIGFVCGGTALFLIGRRATGSAAVGISAAAMFALNPNVLYLQSTPMTELLLIGLTTYGVWALYKWSTELCTRRTFAGNRAFQDSDESTIYVPRSVSLAFAAACWVRYEAWMVVAYLSLAVVFVLWRSGVPIKRALLAGISFARFPIAAVILFVIIGRVTTGVWLTTTGFFVADNPARGALSTSIVQIWWGLRELTGPITAGVACLTFASLVLIALVNRRRSSLLIVIGLAASAILPCYGFFQGHPFRARYMVPLIPAAALCIAITAGLVPRFRNILPFMVATVLSAEAYVSRVTPVMLQESRLDEVNQRGRRNVTAYLAPRYDGTKILLSMSSLAHYTHELSHEGLTLNQFVHEGNGVIWSSSIIAPRYHVGWILIETQAEGGDMLSARMRADPRFLSGFSHVASGGGVHLYRREVFHATSSSIVRSR